MIVVLLRLAVARCVSMLIRFYHTHTVEPLIPICSHRPWFLPVLEFTALQCKSLKGGAGESPVHDVSSCRPEGAAPMGGRVKLALVPGPKFIV